MLSAVAHAKRPVVFDFDGTLTDVWAIEEPFERAHKAAFAEQLSAYMSKPDLDSAWELAKKTIRSNPGGFGWVHNGKIVAPAHADPYLFYSAVAGTVLGAANGLEHVDRAAVLVCAFTASYSRVQVPFKAGTPELLAAAAKAAPVYVVTNSAADSVRGRLAKIGAADSITDVIGDAKKHLIDEGWEDVPPTQALPQLGRPVYLRRKSYFDALERIRTSEDAGFSDMLVVGDVYELDLALPQALGAKICLAAGPRTAAYERSAVEKAGGYVAETPNDVRKVIECATGQ